MWIHNLNPTIIAFGPLEIRWYGVVYVLGFFLSIWWMQTLRKQGQLALSEEEVWDFAFYLMLGVIIGSRLFMIFWQPQHYLFAPWNLLKIWEGGMSFHGGFVGIVTAAWIYSKKKKLHFWKMTDIMAVPTMFALALGRLANFMNGELVGRVTNKPWCVVFPDYDTQCRHPSTLYAAAKRFAIFGWLVFLTFTKQFKPGFIFWNFVLLEGMGRFIVDFYRQDPIYIWFSLGQWFSLMMVVTALWIFTKKYKAQWKLLFTKTKEAKE